VRLRPLPIFVVELPKPLSLAFEAADEAQAVAFADSPRFMQALNEYLCSKQAGLCGEDFAFRIRPATTQEISVYRDFASEFADMTDCLLFAPVS
jgi:hypothetical protein